MEFKTHPGEVDWWFWAVTLALIIAALAGWSWGYWLVIVVSGVQVLYFWQRENSLAGFATQVRIVYFGFTLFGLWPQVRPFIYAILLVGTFMVTFFDRCVIARVLKEMPWNKARPA